jgi:hypothetical protein
MSGDDREQLEDDAPRTLVHFVGGPWHAMHSHYRGMTRDVVMDCANGHYAFHHAQGSALVFAFHVIGVGGA